MKYKNSLKSLRTRSSTSKKVIRRGVLCIINKAEPRFKARQGKKRAPKG